MLRNARTFVETAQLFCFLKIIIEIKNHYYLYIQYY